ncbi:MAG: hypothetical protein CSA89_01305 [Bacteroidales bacterium]|nr:MAG: hypothetical protein CSA89_01305 [Bacteroidales bacterium]
MKTRHLVYAMLLVLMAYSCNKSSSIGIELQPQDDKITVMVDTFHIDTKDSLISAISAQCIDTMSMLLGDYYSSKYGDIKANLLLQFAPSVGYEFPSDSYDIEADSMMLYLYFKQYFGSGNEPIEISAYELNKNTPEYHTQYLTNFDVDQFVDLTDTQLIGKKVLAATDYSKTQSKNKNPLRSVAIRFSDEQMNRFFNMPQSSYTSNEAFLQEFKGLFLTTTYGKSAMLYIREADIRLFYHYSYKTKTDNGADTTITVTTFLNYPASKDVRQLNSIIHSDISKKLNQRDSVKYITSASGIYPRIKLPISNIKRQIESRFPKKNINKNIFINSAIISIEATEIDSSEIAEPIPTTLLMIPTNEVEDFIKEGSINMLTENKAQTVIYNPEKKEYSLDIAVLINKLIKNENQTDKVIDFLLIPVDIYLDNSNNIKEVRPTKRISAVTVRSNKNSYSPTRLELVYSGF